MAPSAVPRQRGNGSPWHSPFRRNGGSPGEARAAATGPQPRDLRSLIVSLLLAFMIHAAIGAVLLLSLSPAPSMARVPVNIDLVSAGPSRPIVSAPAAPHFAAAGGAPPSRRAAESLSALPGGSGPGGAARPAAQDGGDDAPRTDWDMTTPGRDRPPVFVVRPEIPAWVNEKGGVLTVTVSFTVSPNGIVSGARVASSSGFSDVDSAVVEAVMMWHFSSDPSAGTVSSTIRYVVKGRGQR